RLIAERPGVRFGALVEAAPAGLTSALCALLDVDRRVAIENLRDPVAPSIIGVNRYQSINWIDLAPRYGEGKAELGSIEGSLERLRLSQLDLFFLHSNVVPAADHMARRPDAASRTTLYATFVHRVRP